MLETCTNVKQLTLDHNSISGEDHQSNTDHSIFSIKVPNVALNTIIPIISIIITDITNNPTANLQTSFITHNNDGMSMITIIPRIHVPTPNAK